MEPVVIKVENATVRFNIASETIDSMKEYFVKLVKRQIRFKEFLALKNVNLEVRRGESWGIVGANGAGKSTLLKIICNVVSPSSGGVTVNGNISPMLELGSGFDPNLNAIENIYLQGALLGHSKKFMKEHLDEVVEFSELQQFLEMPIKNYSSGMRARLAFSVATVVDPEILIVDEVLSVGDAAFRAKCMKKIKKMIEGSVTLLYVSHSNETVKQLCEKAIWLKNGEVVMSGSSGEVCDAYMQSVK